MCLLENKVGRMMAVVSLYKPVGKENTTPDRLKNTFRLIQNKFELRTSVEKIRDSNEETLWIKKAMVLLFLTTLTSFHSRHSQVDFTSFRRPVYR